MRDCRARRPEYHRCCYNARLRLLHCLSQRSSPDDCSLVSVSLVSSLCLQCSPRPLLSRNRAKPSPSPSTPRKPRKSFSMRTWCSPSSPARSLSTIPSGSPANTGPTAPSPISPASNSKPTAKTIPWQRDTLDAFTFHLDIPAGATHLDASYDIIEPEGVSATDKLMVLEWNEAILYPAGTPAAQLTYQARLILPDGWKYGTALPVDQRIRQPDLVQAHLARPARRLARHRRPDTIAPSISRRPASPSTMKSTWSPTAKPRSP